MLCGSDALINRLQLGNQLISQILEILPMVIIAETLNVALFSICEKKALKIHLKTILKN